MKVIQALVFDIRADYAHFKKYYTTTSPLTFSIPPKTSMYGIIGAIIGLDKNNNDYLKSFENKKCKIGMEILNPIKKTRIGLNLIDTKKAKMMAQIQTRTQIRTEFLQEPAYRVYFTHEDNKIYDELKNALSNHLSIYTISMGLSENLANYTYLGEYNLTEVENNDKFVEISSVIRVDDDNLEKTGIDFSYEDTEYFADQVAIEMNPDREVTDYGMLVYERNGKTIKAKPKSYYVLNDGKKIMLL